MLITVRVHPGAKRVAVGGAHDGSLVVRVPAPPVDGKANRAVLTALADAFGVRPRDVTLVHGHTARTKVVQIDGADPATLAGLLSRS